MSHGNMRVQLIHIVPPAQDWPLSRHDMCLLAADLGCWGKEVVPAIAKICHSYVHMRCFVLTQGRENATVCVLRWVPVPLWIPFRHTLSLGLIKQTQSFVCPRWQMNHSSFCRPVVGVTHTVVCLSVDVLTVMQICLSEERERRRWIDSAHFLPLLYLYTVQNSRSLL